MTETEQLINRLRLEPHPEGGYYRRTFQADHRQKINVDAGQRYTLTSIFYLLTRESPIGHWHCNASDILHYFHLGGPLEYYMIHPDGHLETAILGSDLEAGHQLQLAVKGGVWKASRLLSGDYGLISEAVAPGFEFEDMQLGRRDALLARFPQHGEVIEALSFA